MESYNMWPSVSVFKVNPCYGMCQYFFLLHFFPFFVYEMYIICTESLHSQCCATSALLFPKISLHKMETITIRPLASSNLLLVSEFTS